LQPKTMEQKYYRHLFDSMYPHCEKIIPYFWMPKFVDASDASARTLKIYKEINGLETKL
jgi:asparagine synthase (glutamine-hydrolysing)